MNNTEVIGLGALNIDHIYRVERILGDGEAAANKESISRYREAELKDVCTFPGGSAANTIYGLAKLGIKTGFAGVVGDDAEGKLMLRDFHKAGVDTSKIRVKEGIKTGSALCLIDNLNFRNISVSPATANSLLTMGDVDMDYINQADMLHLSSFVDDPQLEVLLELMTKLDSSVKVSFSPGALYAAKGLEALSPILGRTHILFINEKEIRELTGRDFTTGAKACLERGCQIVVITMGKGTELELVKGTIHRKVSSVCYVKDKEQPFVIEPDSRHFVPEVDTTGAGDAFAAGFLYGLLKEKGLVTYEFRKALNAKSEEYGRKRYFYKLAHKPQRRYFRNDNRVSKLDFKRLFYRGEDLPP